MDQPGHRRTDLDQQPGRQDRFECLDSIRGLAAVCVVCYHMTYYSLYDHLSQLSSGPIVRQILYWLPFKFVYEGGVSAVTMFFVLSGFVLALPYATGRALPYSSYIVRRILRIYPPYLVVIGIALTLRALLGVGPVAGYPEPFQNFWSKPVTYESLINHLLLVTSADQRFNPVTWSLTYEMRMSIIFPVLMFFIHRGNGKVILLLALISTQAGLIAAQSLSVRAPFLADQLKTTEALVPFVTGALMARNRLAMADWFGQRPAAFPIALGIIGLLIFNYNDLPTRICRWSFDADAPVPDSPLVVCIGSAMIIASALNSPTISTALSHPWMLFLGRISYSLYLYHMVILLGLMHLVTDRFPAWSVLLITFFLSFPVASLAYRLVEAPSIKLARRLTSRQPALSIELKSG